MIKKITCFLVFAGILFSFSYTQKIRYGLNLGINGASISEKNGKVYNDGLKYGYSVGIVVDYVLSKKLSIHSGLVYSKKEVECTLSSYGNLLVIIPVDMKLEYLEMPIMLKYNFIRNFYIGLGEYFAKKIIGRLTLFYQENNLIRKNEIGYIISAGINFGLLRKKNFIEFRFSKGITPVFSLGRGYDYYNVSYTCLYGFYF